MIEYKNINLQINNQTIFHHFNLLIKDNEKVLIKAPSGSGKTTLVKLLLGIVKYEGDIFLNDCKLSPSSKNYFRKNISYVSQDVDLQNLKTIDLINEILSYKVNRHIAYNENKILSLLKKLRLEKELLNKTIYSLSGGERARIGLLIALLLEREILILDEVTSGLDDRIKRDIIKVITKLSKTVIIISHDALWEEYNNIRTVSWSNESIS